MSQKMDTKNVTGPRNGQNQPKSTERPRRWRLKNVTDPRNGQNQPKSTQYTSQNMETQR